MQANPPASHPTRTRRKDRCGRGAETRAFNGAEVMHGKAGLSVFHKIFHRGVRVGANLSVRSVRYRYAGGVATTFTD